MRWKIVIKFKQFNVFNSFLSESVRCSFIDIIRKWLYGACLWHWNKKLILLFIMLRSGRNTLYQTAHFSIPLLVIARKSYIYRDARTQFFWLILHIYYAPKNTMLFSYSWSRDLSNDTHRDQFGRPAFNHRLPWPWS